MIDPLDGTVNYLYQLDNFSVSVAVEDADGALVGVVHNPTNGRTYRADPRLRCGVDGQPLRVNDPVPMERALIATGFGYSAERRRGAGRLMVARCCPGSGTSAGSVLPHWICAPWPRVRWTATSKRASRPGMSRPAG